MRIDWAYAVMGFGEATPPRISLLFDLVGGFAADEVEERLLEGTKPFQTSPQEATA